MNAKNHESEQNVLDEAWSHALKNIGFNSFEEMFEVRGWLQPHEASIKTYSKDGETVYQPVPKPEFKEKYEAWLAKRAAERVNND